MKRLLGCAIVTLAATGCYDQRITDLETRVATLDAEHTKTRVKLDSLLRWANRKPTTKDGLMNWVDAVHAKVFPDSTDVVKPGNPPDPF